MLLEELMVIFASLAGIIAAILCVRVWGCDKDTKFEFIAFIVMMFCNICFFAIMTANIAHKLIG
jgi:hypothetical protein